MLQALTLIDKNDFSKHVFFDCILSICLSAARAADSFFPFARSVSPFPR